ncbi:MAG: hypothetical protein ABIV63_19880, partial [Caldimonas sp.]
MSWGSLPQAFPLRHTRSTIPQEPVSANAYKAAGSIGNKCGVKGYVAVAEMRCKTKRFEIARAASRSASEP